MGTISCLFRLQNASRRLSTPPNRHLPSGHPQNAPLAQVLALVPPRFSTPPIPFKQRQRTPMNRLLLMSALVLVPTTASAQEPLIKHPEQNTVEMSYYTRISWQ